MIEELKEIINALIKTDKILIESEGATNLRLKLITLEHMGALHSIKNTIAELEVLNAKTD